MGTICFPPDRFEAIQTVSIKHGFSVYSQNELITLSLYQGQSSAKVDGLTQNFLIFF